MTTKLNVLFWYWGRTGGGARYSLLLFNELKKCSRINLSISVSRNSDFYDEFLRFIRPRDLVISTYDTFRQFLGRSLLLIVLALRFRIYCEKNKIRAIVCPMSHLWNLPILLMKPRGIAYVLVVHDAIPHEGEKFRVIRRWLLNQELKRASGLIFLTESVEQQALHYLPHLSVPTTIIPHGLFSPARDFYRSKFCRLNRLRKLESQDFTRNVRFMFFGRIMPYKGLSRLVYAFKELIDEVGPGPSLVIYGDGFVSTEVLQVIQHMPSVSLVNKWVAESDTSRIFEDVDFCVLPYFQASQSGVIPLALAHHTPVIITPIQGLQEQLNGLNTGFVLQGFDQQSILDGLLKCCLSPHVLHDYVRQCELWSQRHDWRQIANSFEEFLLKEVTLV